MRKRSTFLVPLLLGVWLAHPAGADDAWKARLATQLDRLEASVAAEDGETVEAAGLPDRVRALDLRLRALETAAGLEEGHETVPETANQDELLGALTLAAVSLEGRLRRVRAQAESGDEAEDDVPPARPGRAPTEDEAPLPVADAKEHLDVLAGAIRALSSPPPDGGHDDRLLEAWRDHARSRHGRMERRLDALESPRLWVRAKPTGFVTGLEPSRWTSFNRTVATLHTELGVVADGYRSVRVSPDHALAVWRQRNPGPRPIGPVPSEDPLAAVQASIRSFLYQGLPVPVHLRVAEARLIGQVAVEQEAAREAARREYEALRAEATAAILANVDATRARLAETAAVLERGQAALRGLVATAQRLEEERLRRLLDAAAPDPTLRAKMEGYLSTMASARLAARHFSGSRLTAFGSDIEQDWLLPRNRFLALLPKGD